MKYMLLIYQNPANWETISQPEREQIMEEATAIMDELRDSGEWVRGDGLANPSQAKSIRARDGVPAVTDGPFLEAKEQLAGICVLESDSIERAVDIGIRWPDTRYWGVEIRPLMSSSGSEM